MKEFDTFLARVQARRAWLEQAATNCRARVRRERQETERLRTRRILLGAFLAVVSIAGSLFAIYVAPDIQTKAEQDAARVEELEAENARLLSELRRLDKLVEKENRDGAEWEPVMDASDLYVDESAAAIYNAPAWMQAGEFRIYHYCACEECTGKSPGDRGYGITKTGVKARTDRTIITGIIGCLLYVIGDLLYAATGKGQTTETVGLITKIAYLDMATWRMWASILCGFAGTILYYMGFHRMYALLKVHVTEPKDRIWVKLFHAAYVMGTVAWAWVHAMFMTNALIFKFVFEAYGDMQTAADIANRVLYANAPGMVIAYIVCDAGLAVTMIAMVWKKIIPLRSTGARILATFCNPIMLPGVVGNLVALLPWPINQIDHGTESFGHALVLMLGLTLLKEMTKAGEPD